MASNVFYLTMTFYYFYGFILLALTLPLVYRRTTTPLIQAVDRTRLAAAA
jgi:hypothetical protein